MNRTQLVRGESARKLIYSTNFIAHWNKLAEGSSGYTRLQEAGFVLSWYKNYSHEYDPVVFFRYSENDTLLALMCLAWNREKRFITHAGHQNAEYHGWLALEGCATSFLGETFQQIKSKFGVKKWIWRWLPPGVDMDLLQKASNSDAMVVMETRPSPIWELSDRAKLQKLTKSRSLKSKLNRLKKRGELQLELITDPGRTAEVLEIVSEQTDFRQEAINNALPFGHNPQKIKFSSDLQAYPGTIHVTALWLGTKLLAFHLGSTDGKRLCLGLSSYDPSESKFSPGTLLMVKIAELITEEGFEVFDLTPGTDGYKERFATNHQLLGRPCLYFTNPQQYIGKLKLSGIKITTTLLPLLQMNAAQVRNWKHQLGEWPIKMKTWHKQGWIKVLLNLFVKKRTLYLYELRGGSEHLGEQNTNILAAQQYQDLLRYNDNTPFIKRRGLLKDALVKFGKGDALYSVCKDDKLKWLAWVTDANKPIFVRNFPKPFELNQKGRVLYDLYFHSSEKNPDEFYEYLLACLAKVATEEERVYLCLEEAFQLSNSRCSYLGIHPLHAISMVRLMYLFKFYQIIDPPLAADLEPLSRNRPPSIQL